MLLKEYQNLTNDPKNYVDTIEMAVQNRDVKTLESLMCNNIKENTPNLSKKVKNLYNSIEGTITDVTLQEAVHTYNEADGTGREIKQAEILYYVQTDSHKDGYLFYVVWETINNFQPEETKIRAVHLFDEKKESVVAKIYATNGLFEWHE